MTSILKHWREAATLLMVVRNTRAMAEEVAAAAQTIISGQKWSGEMTTVRSSDCDYKILLQKRSGNLKFFANAYVFPGGAVDSTDFSKAWVELFSSFGVDILSTYRQWRDKQVGEQAPMLSGARDAAYSYFPTDLAFRICSIRETFEESGVLLARQPDDFQKVFQKVMRTNYSPASVFPMDVDSIRSWKERLYKDPSEFLNLCMDLRVLPDVWALFEWSNWLTPPISPSLEKPHPRRFDTMFYVCLLQSEEKPLVVADDKETVHTMWSSPIDAFSSHIHNESYLGPPQAYEMCRFLSLPSFQALETHMKKTSCYRVARWMPVILTCANGRVAYFPGDDHFPAIPDVNGEKSRLTTKASIEDMQQESTNLNHISISSTDVTTLQCNINQEPAHANTLTISGLKVDRPK